MKEKKDIFDKFSSKNQFQNSPLLRGDVPKTFGTEGLPLLIRASAGTGKTYRLSLEYINLLLQHHTDFTEILVITFTRKATAEIRERIFAQLREIVQKTAEGEILIQNIRNINPALRFDENDLAFLQTVYQKMLTHKSEVRISTIDSFVNTIFSGIIAPFHNIGDFSIDNNINDKLLPEIYEYVLQEKVLDFAENIFFTAKQRNLKIFHTLIKEIIEKRWLFEFVDLSHLNDAEIQNQSERALHRYQQSLHIFLDLLQNEIRIKAVPVLSLLQKDFVEAISSQMNLAELTAEDFSEKLFPILTDPQFLEENFKLLLNDKKNIWDGKRLRNKDLKSLFAEVQEALAIYLYYDKALIEELNIISLAAAVLRVYDEIKFRDHIFTYSDISYYTFRYLYDPQLSLVEKENVLNLFYEQLSFHTRFVLIDEFQDTSILQWKILYPLLKEITSGSGQKDYGNVIVVGDEKQAIYGWRGGERRLLTDFAKILQEPVTSDFLTTSFRSKPVLLDWLNRLFSSSHLDFSPDWEYAKIACAKPEGGFVQVDLINNGNAESKPDKTEIYQKFVQKVLLPNLQEGKITAAETAILMRKNDELKIMAQVLEENGIDYTLETSG
nr:UvrD-helicase domain-containing protein [Candidatus Cloacimonadota bacterium]